VAERPLVSQLTCKLYFGHHGWLIFDGRAARTRTVDQETFGRANPIRQAMPRAAATMPEGSGTPKA
jgi:hypothetical protein